MDIPRATYRIQFNGSFRFQDASVIASYLADLGVSHVYASPIFKARKGSPHGYDIVDPNEINPELGTQADFEGLVATLKSQCIGWIQDVVPNHMAYDCDNPYLADVLEKGRRSRFAEVFDIDWESGIGSLRGRDLEPLLAPFLGRPYSECLERGEMKILLGASGFVVKVGGLHFPANAISYATILGPVLERLAMMAGQAVPRQSHSVSSSLQTLITRPGDSLTDDEFARLKQELWGFHEAGGAGRQLIDARLEELNGLPGSPGSLTSLDAVLSIQYYRLAHWRLSAEQINYRRFFDISELIGVRVEDGDVFRLTHTLIFRLIERGLIDGLRVDHIDGLFGPTTYLRQMRQRHPGMYLIVEKILDDGEDLPAAWPVQGTTGYDFLNAVNGLFVSGKNAGRMERLYRAFTGLASSAGQLLREKKRIALNSLFRGDLARLCHLTERIAAGTIRGRDLMDSRLRQALAEVLIAFPVYRTYVDGGVTRDADPGYIGQALAEARSTRPGLDAEIDFIAALFDADGSDAAGGIGAAPAHAWRGLFQQLSSPLTAKGFEDTFLYAYNRLLSLNEVGGFPGRFGISPQDFHRFCTDRMDRWPNSLNATATHDTKRGEDARARLNVLSEFPGLWTKQIRHWGRINRRRKSPVLGKPAPDRNDEYFFYQALIGAFPFEGNTQVFRDRMKVYAVKALREAKRRTSWQEPDGDYEAACLRFLETILAPVEDNRFLAAFSRFQRRISSFGLLNSLSQLLIKMTAPGVPDFYQGSELWDFNLVDPDNRRPVDFALRRGMLADIQAGFEDDPQSLIGDLLASMEDGRVKMFLIWRALSARRRFAGLFSGGEYHPLWPLGRRRNSVVAFARHIGPHWAVTVVPRLLYSWVKDGNLPLGRDSWADTSLTPVHGMPSIWRDAVTGEKCEFEGKYSVGRILQRFPAALLLGDEGHPRTDLHLDVECEKATVATPFRAMKKMKPPASGKKRKERRR
jgi:(1->4)-alpha-D-glucan 1-alpha-D-glucosylmutase